MRTAVESKKHAGLDDGVQLCSARAGSGLHVAVLLTSMNRTLKAMEKAGELANPLTTGIEILAVKAVPFMLPLDRPPVLFDFIVRHLVNMAERFPVPTKISAYLCRDEFEALKRVMSRDYPVVIGVRKKWWPTRDERIARRLRRAGYRVILVETD